MVSTRTLLAAGIAIIAVISLSAVVVVQQIALQRQSVTLSTAYTSTPTSTAPYVIVSYFGYTFTEFGNCKSSSGHVYLNVWIKMENHGCDRVPTASVVIGNSYPYYFYVGIGGQQLPLVVIVGSKLAHQITETERGSVPEAKAHQQRGVVRSSSLAD